MLARGKNYRSIWLGMKRKRPVVKMIDQTALPFSFRIFESMEWRKTAGAIKEMRVRGAPAIGAAGGYALAQAACAFSGKRIRELMTWIRKARKEIEKARPTAVDLSNALEFVEKVAVNGKEVGDVKKRSLAAAEAFADETVEACKNIGEYGNSLIPKKANILTHCNAGALATVDYGTALAPIRFAHYSGKRVFVYVDETRPRFQGALTSWELTNERIKHVVIVDNARGHLMKRGKVDMVLVGADRIALNGDFANKIGTYEIAVLAKENRIPFYVCAPSSTFDPKCRKGSGIKIEERDEKEILMIGGKRVYPKGTRMLNPSFDVTPAKYVTAFVTEKGVFKRR
jgi:S-methyl-5-thioribose-1-phosphate isomerase